MKKVTITLEYDPNIRTYQRLVALTSEQVTNQLHVMLEQAIKEIKQEGLI